MPENPDETPGLSGLQAWFGKAISRPLPESYSGNPLAVSDPGLAGDAAAALREKGGLSGFDRLGIYNQQYWFRLVSIMQSEYPCVLHLMGLKAFNAWVVRFLAAHPPSSPYLADLDAAFPQFLEAHYREEDRNAVLQAAAYERAVSRAFDAPEGAPLEALGRSDPEALLAAPLRLAPHVTLLRVDSDFAEYRARCQADESLEERLAPLSLAGPACLAVFRDRGMRILKEEISPTALAVLREFGTPGPLAEIFARLEDRLGPEEQAELEKELAGWFRNWTAQGWLCLATGPEVSA
jgi:hypothetical protein